MSRSCSCGQSIADFIFFQLTDCIWHRNSGISIGYLKLYLYNSFYNHHVEWVEKFLSIAGPQSLKEAIPNGPIGRQRRGLHFKDFAAKRCVDSGGKPFLCRPSLVDRTSFYPVNMWDIRNQDDCAEVIFDVWNGCVRVKYVEVLQRAGFMKCPFLHGVIRSHICPSR